MADDEMVPTEFEIEQHIGIKFCASEVVENLGHAGTIQLIKELDLALEDWGATEEIAKYFELQMQIMEREEAAPEQYMKMTDTECDYREECVICQNEGGHDVEDRPHVLEGQE